MIIPSDVLCGTREIARHLRVNQVQALRLLRSGRVPGQFVRGRWYARASELDAYLDHAAEART